MANFDRAYKLSEPFIKKWEGGISGNPSDSASENPSPCGTDTKYNAPYHTNKGVTWATFQGNANALGYNASCDNFLNMPESIWKKLYKQRFWDAMNADQIQSDVIASFVTEVAWMSGAGSIGGTKGAYPFFQRFLTKKGYTINSKQDVVNSINQEIKKDEGKLFDDIIAARRQHFESMNQPTFIKGWLRRLDDFNNNFRIHLTKTVQFTKRNWIPITIVIVGLAGLGYYLVKSKIIRLK